MKSNEWVVDNTGIKNSIMGPAIAAGAYGLLFGFSISLGGFGSLIMLVIWVWAGIQYAKSVLTLNMKPSIINLVFNAAILAAIVDLVKSIIYYLIRSINGGALPYIPGIISSLLQAAIVGGIAAAGWYFYQTNKKE